MFELEQMNEGSKAIELTEARKKRRRSGLRFSSRRVLERSRLKRDRARNSGYQFDSVSKALSFQSEIFDIDHCDHAAGSSNPPCLDSVLEQDGAGIDLTFESPIIQEAFNQEVC